MNTAGTLIDLLLYAMLALTLALILYKTLDLWFPALVGRPSFDKQLGGTSGSLDAGIERLESGMVALAAMGSAAPLVGLVGTVIHIMDALRALGSAGADVTVISGPIVTALNATLVGLACAIPAVIAHGLMSRRLQLLENRHQRQRALAEEHTS